MSMARKYLGDPFSITPDDSSLPLVFKYTKLTKPENFKFTSAASYFDNKELMESKNLKTAWRVSFSPDEEEYQLLKLPLFGVPRPYIEAKKNVSTSPLGCLVGCL